MVMTRLIPMNARPTPKGMRSSQRRLGGPASYVLAISGVSFPINESAQMSGVLALSNDDLATHIKAINEHRKAIDHRQRSMRMTSRPCSIWPMMKTTTLKTVLRF
jgi:hypothetical protein